ncbi:ABC transporter ATP-binding protein [Actinomadura macra]|uniref:ABC transporter ATP-binding protein n=1 Tax=Actinomadura macra TaxID=46164 RepID=UPI00082D2BC1|nr:ABC transporter ATP-binding protein [Actinomadura macra]
MAQIGIAALTRAYTATNTVLDEIDLDVKEGELLGLLGPSGCGKSTLLRCVAGLDRPQSGRISIGDRTMTDPAARCFVPPESRNLGMVFQNYALWPHLSVAQNVAYPLRRRKVRGAELDRRVSEALELVGLPETAGRRPGQLSGGQQQRVSIARAIVTEPSVLLFDEPLSNLDANLRRLLRREIRALHERTGTTALYVTHDQDEIGGLADRVAVLAGGRVAQLGTPREVFTLPATRQVAEFVGFDVFIPGVAVSADGADCTVQVTDGRVRAPHVGVAGPGRPVLIAARSRALTVRPADTVPGPGAVGSPSEESLGTGRVVAIARLGDGVEVEVDLPGTGKIVAVLGLGRDSPLERGQRVLVSCAELVVLPAEDGSIRSMNRSH